MTGIGWIFLTLVATQASAEPFQATGFKVGEMTSDSAIVWTRLTAKPESNSKQEGIVPTFIDKEGKTFTGDGFSKVKKPMHPVEIRWPEGKTCADMRYGAPGAPGETRVRYRPVGDGDWSATEWATVRPEADFTRAFSLGGLQSGTRYQLQVESRTTAGAVGEILEGGFVTAPPADAAARVVFAVSTGQAFHDQDRDDGFQLYPTMLKSLKPDFFVHTGDIVYYDGMAKSLELAWWHWQRTYSRPTNVAFHRQVGSYFIKDDHDTWFNDSWPGQTAKMGTFTWEDGVRVFTEQVPMSEKTYRTRRWGRDLQIWMVEGRDFRSPNNAPDGPDKTIWGKEQFQWLRESMTASDATFRVLISPMPIVGPDRGSKNDNHSNAGFTHEGDRVRAFLAGLNNTVVICGDRHWQYHSVHPELGLREYSCGPASNEHAGGWDQKDYRDDWHRFLRVKGGYLSGTVEPGGSGEKATLTFRFHGVRGNVHFEDRITAAN